MTGSLSLSTSRTSRDNSNWSFANIWKVLIRINNRWGGENANYVAVGPVAFIRRSLLDMVHSPRNITRINLLLRFGTIDIMYVLLNSTIQRQPSYPNAVLCEFFFPTFPALCSRPWRARRLEHYYNTYSRKKVTFALCFPQRHQGSAIN
jgi:hypothetical protein